MDIWLVWLISGLVLMLLETIIPGGIIVFLGLAASVVAAGIYLGQINSLIHAFLAWFIVSLILIVSLRSICMKYFEGDKFIENTDEDIDSVGKIVDVIEDIQPYQEGRVKFLDSTWIARSDERILKGERAIITGRDGSKWIVKAI